MGWADILVGLGQSQVCTCGSRVLYNWSVFFHSRVYSGLDTYYVITQTSRHYVTWPLPTSWIHPLLLLCSLGASHSGLLLHSLKMSGLLLLQGIVLIQPQIFAWLATSYHSSLNSSVTSSKIPYWLPWSKVACTPSPHTITSSRFTCFIAITEIILFVLLPPREYEFHEEGTLVCHVCCYTSHSLNRACHIEGGQWIFADVNECTSFAFLKKRGREKLKWGNV